jgi:LysM repeat protein
MAAYNAGLKKLAPKVDKDGHLVTGDGDVIIGDLFPTPPTPPATKPPATTTPAKPPATTTPAPTTPTYTSYTVKKGDTLSGIAKTYGTTVAKLVEINSIKDPDLIQIGQVLKIPKKHKGGVVDGTLPEYLNQLFNLKPDERLVKALAGELFIPKENIKSKFLPNLAAVLPDLFMNSLIDVPGVPATHAPETPTVNQDVNVESMVHIDKAEFYNGVDVRQIEEESARNLKRTLLRKGIVSPK